MLTFEIDFADSHCTSILALAVFQGLLGGCSASICARKGHGFVEIPVNQGIAPAAPSRMLTFEIDFT